MVRTETRYDVWECARCGYERSQPSLPHDPPQHCGTGMFFKEMFHGRAYLFDPDPEGRD